MYTTTYVQGVTMVTITCCHAKCGVVFAVPQWWEKNRREDHTWWYCPNGHQQHFTGPTGAEKRARELASKLERKEAELEQAQQAANRAELRAKHYKASAAARKGQITKIKNRIANGVCPVAGCKRSGFSNVQNHIHQKHPSWQMPEEDA